MNKSTLIVGSWASLSIAIAVWCLVGVCIFELFEMQNERIRYANEAARVNLQQGQAAQLHALARETAADRAMLEREANIDVLNAVNMIESVGAGTVHVQVTGAQADRPAVDPKKPAPIVNTVTLTVHAEGPFAALEQTLQLLETLPLATTLQSAGLSRAPLDRSAKNSAAPWVLDVQMKLFTTVALSS